VALESFSFLNSLVVTNPIKDDFLIEGDDHIRGIKQALRSTFPGVTGPVTATHTELNRLTGIGSNVLKTTGTSGEWVLMASANVSGAPQAIDFLNGVGGITISNAFDAYEIELIDVYPTATIDLRLSFSSGSGFPNNATGGRTQVVRVSGGAQTIVESAANPYVVVCSEVPGSGAAFSVSATIRVVRPTASLNAPVFSEWVMNMGGTVGTCRGYNNAGSSQFTGLRIATGSGGVQLANHGSYRFRARRA
jgi:hypothetical protein